jgi:hypothetical protein
MTPLTRTNHRIKQLERCLQDVLRWTNAREIEFNDAGADKPDNTDYRALMRLRRRVCRTVQPYWIQHAN